MRALLSVYDKEGLVELAQGLADLGWELVASGNTAAALAGAGIAHLQVADVTGSPEMLGGRVKTLHPKIHGGILADRDEPSHLADLEAHGIEAIDLVVSNLYPFSSDPSIELIDIGGPAMVRAAAKNHAHVGIVTSPGGLPRGAGGAPPRPARSRRHAAPSGPGRLRPHRGLRRGHRGLVRCRWPGARRRRRRGREALGDVLPPTLHLTLERTSVLRYGENPHQRGARYRTAGAASWWDERGAARRQGALLPQPVRRRRGLAPGARAGAATPGSRRWPSSSTPTPAAPRWPTTWSPPTSGRSSATCSRPSAAWWPSAGR